MEEITIEEEYIQILKEATETLICIIEYTNKLQLHSDISKILISLFPGYKGIPHKHEVAYDMHSARMYNSRILNGRTKFNGEAVEYYKMALLPCSFSKERIKKHLEDVNPLYWALRHKMMPAIKYCLVKDLYINEERPLCYSPLEGAIFHFPEFIRPLLEKGAKITYVNASSSFGTKLWEIYSEGIIDEETINDLLDQIGRKKEIKNGENTFYQYIISDSSGIEECEKLLKRFKFN